MAGAPKEKKEVLKRAPTLYAIIAFKLIKGLLFVGLAIVVYCYSNNDLPADFEKLLEWLKVNPERKFWSDLANRIGTITEAGMLRVAAGTLIYSLFSLVEGVGLMFRVSWAGWLAIGESLFFIPLEVHSLIQKFHWLVFVILIVNIFIVWYLFTNRDRLFRHHHRH